MSISTHTTWPEGLIARYLTVGGATVDVSHDTLYLADTEPNVTTASCEGAGCEAYHNEEWGQYAYRFNNGSSAADEQAGKWAQAHAEKCRAMPRPDQP
ncbi:hypothetical protein ACFVT2_19655 [Streptomyces sp. NPDC058000]|uniref:hypothetical protein n=1 Tax=Streptomyces sp. NPDC058000 TaxID=3346299 RepID=UPI0036E1C205